MDRRNAIRTLAGLGVGSVVFQRSIAAMVQDGQEITPKMIADAEWVAGVKLSAEDRKKTAQALGRSAARIAELRNVPLSNDVAPAVHFKTLAGMEKCVMSAEFLVLRWLGVRNTQDMKLLTLTNF